MAVKITLFQDNSNLTRHLQFKSCRIGKLPVQRKERKQNTHTNSSVIITMIHNLFCLRRGMKPTTRTRAQNPLPDFFEVAVAVQTTIYSSLFEL